MDSELRERAQRVLRDAAGRQGEELEVWLDQTCGDDPELRQGTYLLRIVDDSKDTGTRECAHDEEARDRG